MAEKKRILKIREDLERLAATSLKHFQWEIEHNKLRRGFDIENPGVIHNFYVDGLNNAYQKICEKFNVEYSPIKSEIKIN